MNNVKSTLIFKNYLVNEATLKVNFDFSGRENVDLSFDIQSDYKIEENNFFVTLGVVIFPEAKTNDYPFYMKVEISGLFEVEEGIDENTKINFIERNALTILFPYVRALLSVYSSNSNIGTIILPPINVVKYLEEKKKARK